MLVLRPSEALAAVQQPTAAAPPLRLLVIEDVTVVDVQAGRHISHQTVVVDGNRVRAVDSVGKVRPPAGARRVSGTGKYLIPGLWDMHVHVWHYPQVYYPLFIANGVTGVREMGTPVPLDTVRQWRREVMLGTRIGPRAIGTGALIEIAPIGKSADVIPIATPDRAQAVVDSLKAAGADFLKLHADSMPRETFFAIAAAARRAGIDFAGHFSGRTITPAEASDSGQRSFEHIRRSMPFCSDLAACTAMAELFIRNDSWVTPTLVVTAAFDGGLSIPQEYENYLSRFKVSGDASSEDPAGSPAAGRCCDSAMRFDLNMNGNEDWGIERHLVQLLHDANIPLLAGTDALPNLPELVPGFTLHEELRLLTNAGHLTPLEALQAATLNPARFLHATDSLGTVAVGKLADLVLLTADPLAAIENTAAIAAVVANGRFYDRRALDILFADAAQAAAQVRNAGEEP